MQNLSDKIKHYSPFISDFRKYQGREHKIVNIAINFYLDRYKHIKKYNFIVLNHITDIITECKLR